MTKKAIIYDLDNTLYSVLTIGDELFADLLDLIVKSEAYEGELEGIRSDIMRKPFQWVAKAYHFSEKLTCDGIDLLQNLTVPKTIKPFEDYTEILKIKANRFLVTSGFTTMQFSKIRNMGIENDFTEVHVVDPMRTSNTKKDVFADIMMRYDYKTEEVLVVGDDLDSEIKAAHELRIDTVLYDKNNNQQDGFTTFKISDFKDLVNMFIK